MQRSLLRAYRRGAGRRSAFAATPRDPPPDLRAARDAHVAGAQERVFGPQQNMPGDRYFRKPLEGRKLMRWYFPSKYGFQDFRVDDYFEMQGERLAPREVHRCMPALDDTLAEVSRNREALRTFFAKLDADTFLHNPSLQDLYGLFRMVDAEGALPFTPPPEVFQEHHPLLVEAEEAEELHALLREKLGPEKALQLEARVQRAGSMEEVRKILREQAKEHNVLPKLQDMTVYVDYEEADEDAGIRRSAQLKMGPRSSMGGSAKKRAKAQKAAQQELDKLRKDDSVGGYMARRHRFIDPMFRRRRLKWLERQMAEKNNATEVKFNSYYATHPDSAKNWPSNKGSVTVVWPSPYH